MRKFKATFFLVGRSATYYLEAVNEHEATVAAQRRCAADFGPPKPDEDLIVNEFIGGKLVGTDWPTDCDNPYGLPCCCGARATGFKFINKEQAMKMHHAVYNAANHVAVCDDSGSVVACFESSEQAEASYSITHVDGWWFHREVAR